jgi:hypothetical protein
LTLLNIKLFTFIFFIIFIVESEFIILFEKNNINQDFWSDLKVIQFEKNKSIQNIKIKISKYQFSLSFCCFFIKWCEMCRNENYLFKFERTKMMMMLLLLIRFGNFSIYDLVWGPSQIPTFWLWLRPLSQKQKSEFVTLKHFENKFWLSSDCTLLGNAIFQEYRFLYWYQCVFYEIVMKYKNTIL